MIWAITVWMLLTTGLTMETREFKTLAECEAYRLTVERATFSLEAARPSGTGLLIGACKAKVVDSPRSAAQR
jgi:hypothetical protein